MVLLFTFIFFFLREEGRGREKEASDEKKNINADGLPPATTAATTGNQTSTQACALTGNGTVTSWYMGGCSTAKPHRLGRSVAAS